MNKGEGTVEAESGGRGKLSDLWPVFFALTRPFSALSEIYADNISPKHLRGVIQDLKKDLKSPDLRELTLTAGRLAVASGRLIITGVGY